MDTGKKPLGTETRTTEPAKLVEAEPSVTQPTAPVKEKKHYSSKRFVLWRTVVIMLLIAATAIVVAGWFYMQDLYSQLGKKDAEITQLQQSGLKTDAIGETSLAGGEGFIPQSAIGQVVGDYLLADKTYSGSDANFTQKIRYMSEMFARVDILEVDALDKNKQTVVDTFYLKNVATSEGTAADDSNRWVLIWTDGPLTAADKTELKNTFSVPDEVFTALREG